MPILYLTEADVGRVLTMELALDAVGAAFRKLALEEAVNNPRQRCQTDHVMLHVLPAAAKTLGALGFKAYTVAKSGEAKFQVTLFDPKHGGISAVIEADLLGQFRTGAATGVATKKLARADASTVGLFGTGKQARTQLLAVCKVRPIKKAHVYGRDAERRKTFAAQLAQETGVEVIPVDRPEEAAQGLDIVITATTSREPVLLGEWVSEGQHLNVVGSNFLAKTETDVEVFRRTQVVSADSKEQAKLEAGDFVEPVKAGVLQWADVLEFAPLLVGRYPGRESPQDVTLFKSLGLGIQDIALAAKVVELAKQQGLGRELL
ncbi:L-lysine cyclodeaminase [Gemmata obscuriglobus]|uniref:Ornithine cyclodeaminase n=1 Tax=Gemmata obscuriglobus TaxID=114 RepID=A0A2Z3H0A4_9BACT|nr:ornithine cyclodeaminase family protein [Gemmata obscuriglobus]AWM37177.1 ornithine cyclodeaminase [Gemmata obscuriglobus]QEG30089.1 L-lysine cyclodeaminase [Gemmata obscuriglobus]VTS09410.1 Ornithine cyclodeaminase OS=uncultured planctomycete GN=HGMM_F11G08C23 PE=4 SV=1: OCD_Mu_crystall [Gemmata obscuriglobus UQM 2246]